MEEHLTPEWEQTLEKALTRGCHVVHSFGPLKGDRAEGRKQGTGDSRARKPLLLHLGTVYGLPCKLEVGWEFQGGKYL